MLSFNPVNSNVVVPRAKQCSQKQLNSTQGMNRKKCAQIWCSCLCLCSWMPLQGRPYQHSYNYVALGFAISRALLFYKASTCFMYVDNLCRRQHVTVPCIHLFVKKLNSIFEHILFKLVTIKKEKTCVAQEFELTWVNCIWIKRALFNALNLPMRHVSLL